MALRTERTVFQRLVIDLVRDESGQDLLEYALVTGAIGLFGAAAWQSIVGGIGTAYTGWDSSTQNLWEPPDPV